MARLTDEEKALRDADKTHKQRVKKAEKALEIASEGQLIGQCGQVKLYGDRLVHGNNTLLLQPGTKADVRATGAITAGKDGKQIDSRQLYLLAENASGGMTVQRQPNDGARVHEFAQQIRVCSEHAESAASARERKSSEAAAALSAVRADRSEIEAAERALPADAVERVRRRQRRSWIKWTIAGTLVVFVVLVVIGSTMPPVDPTAATTAPLRRLLETGGWRSWEIILCTRAVLSAVLSRVPTSNTRTGRNVRHLRTWRRITSWTR